MSDKTIIEEMVVKLVADTSELVSDTKKGIKDAYAAVDEVTKSSSSSLGGLGDMIGKLKSGTSELGGKLKGVMGTIGGLAEGAVASIAGIGVAISMVSGIVKEFWAKLEEDSARAINKIRLEREFATLSASISQSSTEMATAMKQANDGYVSGLDLTREAVYALNAGLELTPELISKLTSASITFSKAELIPQQDAFKELTDAIAHADTEKLARMGVSIKELYANMDSLANSDFGKPVEMLSSIERQSVYTASAIEAVNARAEEMGGAFDALGVGLTSFDAEMESVKENTDETALVISTFLKTAWAEMKDELGNTDFMKSFAEKSFSMKDAFIQAMSAITAATLVTVDTVSSRLSALGDFMAKKIDYGQLKSIFDETKFSTLKDRYNTQRDSVYGTFNGAFGDLAQTDVAAEGYGTKTPGNDEANTANTNRALGLRYAKSIQNTMRQSHTQEQKINRDHATRLSKIIKDGIADRKKAYQKYADAVVALTNDVAKKRESILKGSQQRQKKLQTDYQTETKRREEDYQDDMRRLREEYLYDLEDAVKNRDARAIVDLRRRYELDKSEKSGGYTKESGRRAEDYQASLSNLKSATDEELAALDVYQREQAAALEKQRDDEIARINAAVVEKSRIENQSYANRLQDLTDMQTQRMIQISQSLADENDITAEGAQTILATLSETFGIGGTIDELMGAFVERRNNDIAVAFAMQDAFSMTGDGGGSFLHVGAGLSKLKGMLSSIGSNIPGLATGGAYLAKTPTLLAVGERGPELVTAAPVETLNSLSHSGSSNRVQIEFSGSAPPGIMPDSRDKIAAVILEAIGDTGVLNKH